MNESKLEEKKQLGFTKEILDYLKKNPSVAIAVVSAAITIMSILSSYAGRLANITFLKYWGIDSSYAGLEKENVLYRVVNSAIWIAVIWSISILLQNVFIRIYHDSISYHYAKNEIKNLVKMHKQGLEELKKTENTQSSVVEKLGKPVYNGYRLVENKSEKEIASNATVNENISEKDT